MKRLTALWRKETLALLRDRHGLAALFLMPVIFILVMTMALHDAFMPGAAIDVGYAIVDLDGSPHSQSLVRRLKSGTLVLGAAFTTATVLWQPGLSLAPQVWAFFDARRIM